MPEGTSFGYQFCWSHNVSSTSVLTEKQCFFLVGTLLLVWSCLFRWSLIIQFVSYTVQSIPSLSIFPENASHNPSIGSRKNKSEINLFPTKLPPLRSIPIFVKYTYSKSSILTFFISLTLGKSTTHHHFSVCFMCFMSYPGLCPLHWDDKTIKMVAMIAVASWMSGLFVGWNLRKMIARWRARWRRAGWRAFWGRELCLFKRGKSEATTEEKKMVGTWPAEKTIESESLSHFANVNKHPDGLSHDKNKLVAFNSKAEYLSRRFLEKYVQYPPYDASGGLGTVLGLQMKICNRKCVFLRPKTTATHEGAWRRAAGRHPCFTPHSDSTAWDKEWKWWIWWGATCGDALGNS